MILCLGYYRVLFLVFLYMAQFWRKCLQKWAGFSLYVALGKHVGVIDYLINY
tara:strand:+ start:807 stop:962 length:156 start_codon:yes stop_codon:yes gene_type:complete